ncbi:uncharacterized protein LOC135818167 [Sycon ciliatum]|uniref:uncharacterized protein LOC135818167 n=1 Tax=Sycon ciliatum TaxID=27933 RepID=UPI0031F63551
MSNMFARVCTEPVNPCLGIRRFLCGSSSSLRAACLHKRSALRVSGEDAGKFLQGLVTQDVLGSVHPVSAVQYAHILNAKGRTKYDIMIYPELQSTGASTTDYLVEADRLILADLHTMLKLYRMRAKVDFSSTDGDWKIWVVQGDVSSSISVPAGGRFGPDPRLSGFHRLALPGDEVPPGEIGVHDSVADEYLLARWRHGACEGVEELEPGEALPLEHNLDLNNGVCFKKGCYVGQELTARTHFTGVVRKRALPVRLLSGSGGDFSPGLALASRVRADGESENSGSGPGQLKRAGKLRAWFGERGIAVVPVELARTPSSTVLCAKSDANESTLAIGELSPALEKAAG